MTFWRLSRYQCDCSINIRRTLDFEIFSFLRHSKAKLLASEYSSQSIYSKVDVLPTASAEEAFSLESFKPRKHPGRFDLPRVELPKNFVSSFKHVVLNENLSSIHKRADLLYKYLKSRKLPVEEDEYRIKASKIEDEIKSYDSFINAFLSEEERMKKEHAIDNKIRHRLKKSLYHWEPIDYNYAKSLEYVLARTAGEYAVLCRVFKEIAARDPDFQPETLFDFGSGVGTVIWAAQDCWSNTLVEHMCIDLSRDMNDIAELILRNGSSKNDIIFPGVFFRQFLPTSVQRKYNLVVSSYTLMDLPSAKVRLETIDKLWRNTNKYLVLVEQGTNSGFVALNEARDYILQLHKKDSSGEAVKQSHGHVFSPCPHDTWCPRYMQDHKPCSFIIGYKPLYPFFVESTHHEVFSYVVLRKGERNGKADTWPRLVKEPLRKGGHVICRLCTSSGQLSETVLTKSKHSKKLYRCGRLSSCGDLLPVQVFQREKGETVELDEPESDLMEDDEEDVTEITLRKNQT